MTNQVEEKNQKLQELLLKLGHSYLGRNRYQDAYDKLSQLLALEPANEQALLLVTKAGLALENVSETALDFYTKALDAKPDAQICQKLHTLLENNEIKPQVASELKQKLDALSISEEDEARETPPNESEESIAIVENPEEKFADQIDALCREAKFDEAIKAIDDNRELDSSFLQRQRALTHAYQSLSTQKHEIDAENIENIATQLQQLKPDSLESLRQIVTMLSVLPEDSVIQNGKWDESCEFKFILGQIPMEDFFYELQKKEKKEAKQNNKWEDIIFDDLQKADDWDPQNETLNYQWSSFLATSLVTRNKEIPPERILKLVAAYLYKIPRSVLRFTGNGFLNFAENPLKQITAILNLYKSIDHYNNAANEQSQITLISSIVTHHQDQKDGLDKESFRVNILKALQLHKLTKTQTHTGHSLYVECSKMLMAELRQTDESIKYKPLKKIFLLPGVKSECYDVEREQKEEEKDAPPEIQDLKILETLKSEFPFVTYLTKNRQLERSVILKTISIKGISKNLEKQKEAILTKIKKMGRLNHPNIATLFDVGEKDDRIFYTREYIEGESVLNFDKSEDGWEINFLMNLEKIVRGLKIAANDGIFHLNLKPANIRINEANTIKLTDFYIFQGTNKSNKDIRELKFSTRYLAPEVIQNAKGDSRSDIYSLGLIAYEILSGKSPYSAESDDGNNEAPQLDLLEDEAPTLNRNLIEILRKATHPKPEERHQTLDEFETELKKLSLEFTAEPRQQ